MPYDHELQTLLPAVRMAARLTRHVRETLVVAAEKAGREPVTIADYGSQALICRAIQQYFPADAVIAEERASDFLNAVTADQRQQIINLLGELLDEPVDEAAVCHWLDHGRDREAARTWVIDPIDGTKGFLAGRRYTIAVALCEAGQPVFGLMGCPGYPLPDGTGAIFAGDQTRGVIRLALDGEDSQPVQASPQTDPAQARGVESVESGHTDHGALDQIRAALGADAANVVRIDGQDKYAAVACGDAEYYLRLSPTKDRKEKVWDHAAGAVLVAAAGGTVTDLDGQPLDFSLGIQLAHNRGIIASNGALHERLVTAVQNANL